MSESIKVFENIGDNVLSFETKEDFMRHYNKNKESIDSMSTRGLNRKYHIDGFKIGRLKGEIILYPLKENETKSDELDSKTKLTINEKLDYMNRRLKKIEEMIDYVIKFLEQNE